jgi:uncharacterized OsmC-like protein
MSNTFECMAAAGSLRDSIRADTLLSHKWTSEGVAVQTEFTGAHLLHLAVAGCILNVLYREAPRFGVELAGVRVRARGGFNSETWQSTGIDYDVDVDSQATPEAIGALLHAVDEVAEIPRALRAGAGVRRVD